MKLNSIAVMKIFLFLINRVVLLASEARSVVSYICYIVCLYTLGIYIIT